MGELDRLKICGIYISGRMFFVAAFYMLGFGVFFGLGLEGFQRSLAIAGFGQVALGFSLMGLARVRAEAECLKKTRSKQDG